MKKLKHLSILLAMVTLFGCVGCTNNQGISSGSSSGTGETETVESLLKESPYYLTQNKVSEYKIVYPEDMILGTHTAFALSELQTWIFQATGVELPTVADTDLTYTTDSKYLSIGETSILEEAGVVWDKETLNDSGYVVESKDKSVFMVGGSFGTLNAVYDFLKYQFNFEVYAADEIVIDDCTNKDVKIYEYDLTVVPDFSANVTNFGEMINDRNFTLRMRMQQHTDVFLPKSGTWHNFMSVVNPAKYNDPNRCTVETDHDCVNDSTAADKNIGDYPDCIAGEYHPEWFSNGQLNLSGTTSDLLVDLVVDTWKRYVEQSITKTQIVWTFTQMDTGTWSESDTSLALKEIYGTASGEYILFMNRCAEKMNPWLEENYPENEYGYLIFAYHETNQAPVKEENGQYVPIDDSVIMKDGVQLFYTTTTADPYHSIKDDVNLPIRDRLSQWQAVTNGQPITLWMYGSYYDCYLVPLDLSNCLQKNFQWAKEVNSRIMFYQMQSDQGVASDWSRLKMYLVSKLGQDVNVDVDKLTDDFFANYFKDANSSMRKLYDEMRAWQAYIDETTNVTYAIAQGKKLLSRDYWPYQTLIQWLGYIDQAYQDVAHYKTVDSLLYKKLCDRIKLESITIRYLLLNCYSTRLENKSIYARELLTDCISLGITNENEGTNGKIEDILGALI